MILIVFFRRLILACSTVPSVLVDFAVTAGLMSVLLLLYGVAPGWGLLLLPTWMALLLMLALGFGLGAAALAVSYRDVPYIIPVFLQMLLYASPIAYPLSAVPMPIRAVYLLNPLSVPLEGFHASLFHTGLLALPAGAAPPPLSALVFPARLCPLQRVGRQ